eukprot:gene11644-34353_t
MSEGDKACRVQWQNLSASRSNPASQLAPTARPSQAMPQWPNLSASQSNPASQLAPTARPSQAMPPAAEPFSNPIQSSQPASTYSQAKPSHAPSG